MRASDKHRLGDGGPAMDADGEYAEVPTKCFSTAALVD